MNELKKMLEHKKVLVAAHRGMAGGNIPCNTLPAFELALKSGADILEMDLFKSTDGDIFVFHTGKEPSQLDRHINVEKMSTKELEQLYLVNPDFNETEQKLNRFTDILKAFQGRECILNLDRVFVGDCFPEVIKLVRDYGMERQILLKNAPTKKALRMVEKYASDMMFMPIFMEKDCESKLIEQMNINYVGAELVFSSEQAQIIQTDYIDAMKKAGRILWANALVYSYKVPLAAGHNDDISLTDDPEKGWGWLIEQGFDIIQTDWTLQCRNYVDKRCTCSV